MVYLSGPEVIPEYDFAYLPPEEAVDDFLDGAGNHELKILLGGFMLLDPDRAHSVTHIAQRINTIMRDSSLDYYIRGSDIHAICKHSLAPIGQLAINKPQEGWQAHPDNLQEKLALVGLFGDWSLRWPDTSVQLIYGPSGSISQARSPRIRHTIYQVIKKAPARLYTQDIVDRFDPDQHRQVRGQLKILAETEIISKRQADTQVEPTVEVLCNEYSGTTPLKKLNPETRALYAALATLNPGTQIPVNELVDLAQRVDSSIDSDKLGFRLRSNNRYPATKYITSGANDLRGVISFNTATSQPITELLQGVHDIKNGKKLGRYVAKAEAIIVSDDNIHRLVQKAVTFSPRLHRSTADIKQHLLDITNDHGQLTARQARSLLMQRYPGSVSVKTIRLLLKELASAN